MPDLGILVAAACLRCLQFIELLHLHLHVDQLASTLDGQQDREKLLVVLGGVGGLAPLPKNGEGIVAEEELQ